MAAGLLALLALVTAAGCGRGARPQDVLQERARWNVHLISWAATGDGGLQLDTRVSGPPNSSLPTLTVRFDLVDVSGETADRVWHSYDLAEVPRGGPKDVMVRIPPKPFPVEGIGVSLVLDPSPEERARIRELAELPE